MNDSIAISSNECIDYIKPSNKLSMLKRPSTINTTHHLQSQSIDNEQQNENLSPNRSMLQIPYNNISRKSLSRKASLKSNNPQYATLPAGFDINNIMTQQHNDKQLLPPPSPASTRLSMGRKSSNHDVVSPKMITVSSFTAHSQSQSQRTLSHSKSVHMLETPTKSTPRASLNNISAVLTDSSSITSDGTESITVFVRVRPVLPSDSINTKQCVTVQNNAVVVDNQKLQKQAKYTYDHVFDQSAPSIELYQYILNNIVSVTNGYNATILAYGQTSSGKTFTISGKDGVISQSLQTLYSTTNEYKLKYSVAYLEIYNEKVFDLLSFSGSNDGERSTLDIRESADGTFYVEDLTQHDAPDIDTMTKLIERGTGNRLTNSTVMNAASSRSHSVLCIQCERISADGNLVGTSKLNIVDLAGSEKLTQEHTSNISKETVGINLSLSTLASCIAALASHSKHIPFRDSKLTRLLKDSLGGNARTTMIACVSPMQVSENETMSTLRYAARVKLIKNKPVLLIDPTEHYITTLQQQIQHLKSALLHKNVMCVHMYDSVNQLVGHKLPSSELIDHQLTYESTEQCINDPMNNTSILQCMLQQPCTANDGIVHTDTTEPLNSFFNPNSNDPLMTDLLSPVESTPSNISTNTQSLYNLYTSHIQALQHQLGSGTISADNSLVLSHSIDDLLAVNEAQKQYIATLLAENADHKHRMLNAGSVVTELQNHLTTLITSKQQLKTALNDIDQLKAQLAATNQNNQPGCTLM